MIPQPEIPGVFCYRVEVSPEDVDQMGHANNLAYLRWALDAAVAHSSQVGWPTQRYRRLGAGFLVRQHRIEYLRPALPGQNLQVRTWVSSFRGARSVRCYAILNDGPQHQLLARGETLWVFVDFATGRPRRIPPELQKAFPLVEQSPWS